VATQQVSRSWLLVGFSRRRALDLPEFSQIARTQRTRAPVAAYLAEHPPHPPSRCGVDRFSGAQDSRNGSLTCINLHHCLACRRCCGDTSFMSSLLHQFLTSPQARVLHRQAIRRPLVSCIVAIQPLGSPPSNHSQVAWSLSGTLRRVGPDTGTALSSCPRPCIAARNRFERQAWFQPFQSDSPMHSVPSSPNPGHGQCWEWSRRAGVAVSLSETRSLPRAFARGYDHPRSVACRASTV
jgi:hypothetical protein